MNATQAVARKVSTLGDFAVGKTSVIARAVRNTFSEDYLTTIGVKVDSKALTPAPGQPMRMVLWDIAGAAAIDQLRGSYLGGSHGVLLVADGTRPETVDTALRLHEQACGLLGRTLPAVLLLNKSDLAGDWALSPERMAALSERLPVFSTSAKTGRGVEEALLDLGGQLL